MSAPDRPLFVVLPRRFREDMASVARRVRRRRYEIEMQQGENTRAMDGGNARGAEAKQQPTARGSGGRPAGSEEYSATGDSAPRAAASTKTRPPGCPRNHDDAPAQAQHAGLGGSLAWRDRLGRVLFFAFVAFGLVVLGIMGLLIREALAYSGPVAIVGLLLALAACYAWVAIAKAWA